MVSVFHFLSEMESCSVGVSRSFPFSFDIVDGVFFRGKSRAAERKRMRYAGSGKGVMAIWNLIGKSIYSTVKGCACVMHGELTNPYAISPSMCGLD